MKDLRNAEESVSKTIVIDPRAEKQLDILTERYPQLAGQRENIARSFCLLKDCYDRGGKLLAAGNGGSMADSEHITGELLKGFKKKRPLEAAMKDALLKVDETEGAELFSKLQKPLTAMTLSDNEALVTAYSNDVDPEYAFSQALYAYGRKGDVFLAVSTSGNSRNLLHAAVLAKALGIRVILLTGKGGGAISAYADVTVRVPEEDTYRIQELHLPVYHALCLMLEDVYFDC